MADITRFPFVRHLRGSATGYVIQLRNGKVRRSGVAASFWFRPLPAVISEIPVDDRELPLLFHARTADFQDVTVQATVTYRISDPALAAARVDFTIDPDTGRWRGTPLDSIARLIVELAQQAALDILVASNLLDALAAGPRRVRDAVDAGLGADGRLADSGLQIRDVRVVAIRPEADVERALQTPTREYVQQEADRATYERRALAVERERTISENELQSTIELAVREEQLVTQQGVNQRRRAEDLAGASRIAAVAAAAEQDIRAGAEAGAIRVVGEANGAAEAARLGAYDGIDRNVVWAMALRELAGGLPSIGSVTVTPDLLTGLLAWLTGPTGPTGDGATGDGAATADAAQTTRA